MPNGVLVDSTMGLPDDRSPNNRNVVYSQRVDRGQSARTQAGNFARGLYYIDEIARFILAIAHSGQYPGNHREQFFISQRTVAVVFHQGTLYVATNSLRNDDVEDVGTTLQRAIDAIRGAGYADQVRFIYNPGGNEDRNFHAEMQLLSYFMAKGWRFDQDIIGVSKPCCENCANNLDRYLIMYSYWHREPVGGRYVHPDRRHYRNAF